VELLGEVQLGADLADRFAPVFEPVGVVLFPFEDVFEEVAGAVVAGLAAPRDPRVQTPDRLAVEVERELQLLDLARSSSMVP
jgi:hypothetical protein